MHGSEGLNIGKETEQKERVPRLKEALRDLKEAAALIVKAAAELANIEKEVSEKGTTFKGHPFGFEGSPLKHQLLGRSDLEKSYDAVHKKLEEIRTELRTLGVDTSALEDEEEKGNK